MKKVKEIITNPPTWEELVEMEDRHIPLADWYEDGLRCLILRGPSALCAYIGIPLNHPLARFDYNDIPIECHGGLTFCGEGGEKDKYRPSGFYWYGWDYGHSYDYAFYYDQEPLEGRYNHSSDKKWLVEDVIDDMWSVVYDFNVLMKLAEKMAEKIRNEPLTA